MPAVVAATAAMAGVILAAAEVYAIVAIGSVS
jgi:hypothetical protein